MFLQLSFQIEAEHTDLACGQARISSAVRVEERFDGGLALIMINRAKPLQTSRRLLLLSPHTFPRTRKCTNNEGLPTDLFSVAFCFNV